MTATDDLRTLSWSGKLDQTPILKARPSDFRVCESLVLPLVAPRERGSWAYLLLSKQGYTTQQAIRIMAEFFHEEPNQIGFACLKDDDGITQQHLSIPHDTALRAVQMFNNRNDVGDSWLHLAWLGRGARALQPGMMHGNNFRVIVRNLTKPAVEFLEANDQLTHFSLNYFDAQFFGPAKGQKLWHLVGRSLLENDYDQALELLCRSTPSVVEKAKTCSDSSEFFKGLAPGTKAKYLNAYSAHLWNEQLREHLHEVDMQTVPVVRDGLEFAFSIDSISLLHLIRQASQIQQTIYRWDATGIKRRLVWRPAVVQTQLFIAKPQIDEMNQVAYQCEVSFFLSDGVYASSALAQLFGPVLGYANSL